MSFVTPTPKTQALIDEVAEGNIVRATDGDTVLYMMLEPDYAVMRAAAERQGITFEHKVLVTANNPDVHLCKGAQMDDVRATVLAA